LRWAAGKGVVSHRRVSGNPMWGDEKKWAEKNPTTKGRRLVTSQNATKKKKERRLNYQGEGAQKAKTQSGL